MMAHVLACFTKANSLAMIRRPLNLVHLDRQEVLVRTLRSSRRIVVQHKDADKLVARLQSFQREEFRGCLFDVA